MSFCSFFFSVVNENAENKNSIRMANNLFMPFSPPQARDSQTTGLHTRARLLGTRLKTDNFRWSKMAKGKDPKPI